MKRIFSIRGATCAENTKESIGERTVQLSRALFEKNALGSADIVSVQFSLTQDLDEMNPCAALRKNDVGIDTSRIPLFCTQEAYIKGGLEKVIRIMVTAYMEADSVPVPLYINGAEKLRPDFCQQLV